MAGHQTLANSAKVVVTNYTGTTTINGGRLIFDNLDAFSSPIVNNSTAADALTFNQTTQEPVAGGGGADQRDGAITKSGRRYADAAGVELLHWCDDGQRPGTLIVVAGCGLDGYRRQRRCPWRYRNREWHGDRGGRVARRWSDSDDTRHAERRWTDAQPADRFWIMSSVGTPT